ncbi:MAG: sodium:alanine symporter family protein [Verrucomicrobia bacterium]|nr:sodium:alanine symporter family protein [Verrucomicrobiota bacterium]MBS0645776.1 sodium:alanine symporter family protein [Verrucomicrobiota bacterium]
MLGKVMFQQIDTFFWGYIGFSLIMLLGIYFSFKTRFFQITAFPSIFKTFFSFLFQKQKDKNGLHPLRAFFASVGGMIGIGSVVGIVTALQIGGPGALFWVWVAALFGSIIKYAEIYLGLKYRITREDGGFNGGPMYFLAQAFKSKMIPFIIALLLCLYGIEIYQFSVLTSTIEMNWHVNHYLAIFVLLGCVLYAVLGGVKRVSKICSTLMPVFMLIYMFMSLWVIAHHLTDIPHMLAMVVKSAFTGHAAVGGFVGGSVLLAIQHGMARLSYSADLGIGYDSIIHSESSSTKPEQQARLALLGVFLDCTMCSLSLILVLLTGVWLADDPLPASLLVQTALSHYFPFMHVFMPCFLLILGYTTIIGYACVGIKCAQFLHPQRGKQIYLIYGVGAWLLSSFFDQSQALLVMSLAQACLLMINLLGLFKLRKEIIFTQPKLQIQTELI